MVHSKKEYEAMADIIADELKERRFAGEREMLSRIAHKMGEYFRKNSAFNQTRFLDACFPYGYEDNNRKYPRDATGSHDD